ncbi:DUF5696 domain-containing protein [Spirochaeta dissipatitropha]
MLVKRISFIVYIMMIAGHVFAGTAHVLTPRATAPAPEVSQYNPDLDDSYELLYQGDPVELYFREDRGIFALKDIRNGYVWKTGLDLPFNVDIRDLVDRGGVDPDELPPLEARLNTTFTGIANSVLSIEFFDNANNIRRIGSSAQRNVSRSLRVLPGSGWSAEMSISFEDIDLQLLLQIRLDGDELSLSIPDDAVSGSGQRRLASINLMPFFGASGGRQLLWDPERQDFTIQVKKPAPTGYVVVPDGSGSLIRFRDNSDQFSEYRARIYGPDLSQGSMYSSMEDFSVAPRQNLMPLFGIVHGRNQNAFAAYAVSGAEHLEIITFPQENTTNYTHAYPRFVYNRLYYQVYNQRGDGYFRILENRNRFDLEMRYRFLQGESDSTRNHAADYTGIAQAYRQFLEETNQLPDRDPGTGSETALAGNRRDIPLRIDFVMADVSKGIVGHNHQVTTTIADVREIITDLQSEGITELSTGFIGYARGGTVLSTPGRLRLLPAVGRSGEWSSVLESLAEQGVDASFSRDYIRIAEGQILPWGNVIRAASGWYTERSTIQANAPVNRFYFAKAARSVEWLRRETELMTGVGATSVSIDGIGRRLLSDFPPDGMISRGDTIAIYQSALEELSRTTSLNLYQPNQYLWKYTSRFLNTPVFSTQYLLQTDTVPLLQMVLQGTMDMFAQYSNFSFSSRQDMLRMIDYNVYPSFLITKESSHALLLTNSAEFYSTEYSNYRDLILEVYQKVNGALREVMDARWLNREVLSPGIILNTYDNGVQILINYTKQTVTHAGESIQPESAHVFHMSGGVQ